MIELTTFLNPDDYTDPLAIVNGGECSVKSALFVEDHSEEIPQNLIGKNIFYESQLSGSYFPFDIPGYAMSGEYNKLLVSPFAIFGDGTYIDSDNLEPLPYKYELRFDHIARSQNPLAGIRLFNQNFEKIPKEYYKLLYSASTRCGAAASGAGNSYGPFIIQRSQIDSQKVRAAQGKNMWGDNWGISAIRERQIWEFEHPEFERPPISGDYDTSEIQGFWNRMDDGRYNESQFGNFYISETGYWGQYISGQIVWYQGATGARYGRGQAITGMYTTPQFISNIQSQKYLGGDEYVAADTPYTITLLLPEFLCHKDGTTLWIEYTKYYSYFDIIGILTEMTIPGYKEIVNPALFMHEGLDYTISKENTFWKIILAAAFKALYPVDILYIKQSHDKIIQFKIPEGATKEAWFPHISEGYFNVGNTKYYSWRMIQSMGHAIDWKGHNPSGVYVAPNAVLTDDGYYCGKVVREKARIIDNYKIQVSKRPIFFWSGPRDRDNRNAYYGYPIKTSDPAYDISGVIDPENPWPRYIPPNLLDYGDIYGFYDFPKYNPYMWPGYSHGITIYRNSQVFDNSNIETYDYWNGIIVFSTPINPNDKFEVTYLYEQRTAVIPNFNLNPIYPEQLNKPTTEFVEN